MSKLRQAGFTRRACSPRYGSIARLNVENVVRTIVESPDNGYYSVLYCRVDSRRAMTRSNSSIVRRRLFYG